MAPEIALAQLGAIDAGSVVLDPMAGSGTVVRHASDLGHVAIGFDLDPLAVLMARVWTTPVDDDAAAEYCARLAAAAREIRSEPRLPWIDDDPETDSFVDYWFGPIQRAPLRRIAAVLHDGAGVDSSVRDVARIALSRIIITKDNGASLARDVSHSRPHRVTRASTFDVAAAFERSSRRLRQLLASNPPVGRADVQMGDARGLDTLEAESVDAILTSPPYLNAIDYMRGHRLSLVWLGYRVPELRSIRATTVGAERGLASTARAQAAIVDAMVPAGELSDRERGIVNRYAADLDALLKEMARVLRQPGSAILVVGNSSMKGSFIRSSEGVAAAAIAAGLRVLDATERPLVERHRYLPMPASDQDPLGKRMRTETILRLAHA